MELTLPERGCVGNLLLSIADSIQPVPAKSGWQRRRVVDARQDRRQIESGASHRQGHYIVQSIP